MSWVAAAIGGAAVVGAGTALYAGSKQSDASAAALAQQKQMYDTTRKDLTPYRNVGGGALMTLGQLYGIGADGKPTGQPYNSASTDAFKNSPDYQFAFNQGNQALTFSNAAKGLLQSGSNLKDIVGFGQGLASQQFGNYVNRLSGLATMGQNSAAGGATNALGFAGAMGGTTLAGGQAAASGAVGAANSLTGGVGSYLNYNQQQNNNQMLMNAFGNRNNNGPMDINAPGTVGGNNAVGSGTSGGNPIGLYAEGGRPPVGEQIIVGDDPNRAEGIAALKRRMGGDVPWYMQEATNPAFRRAAMGSHMGWATDISDHVPRRYAEGGRPPMGQPIMVGDQPPNQNSCGSDGGRPWHGNGWQGGDSGGAPNGLAAFGGRQPWGQPGGQPNGLMSASRGFGGLLGFEAGGPPPVGEPIVVGEGQRPKPELFVSDQGQTQVIGANGPEVISVDKPGTIIPNHELPAWMNADTLSPAPPYSQPMTRALPGYENIAPNELATMRHQQMVRPDAGRGDFTPEHLSNMAMAAGGVAGAPGLVRGAIAAAPYLSAEGLAAQVATRAPALAAGGLGAVYAGAPTAAGEQEFRWSDPDKSRTNEMADIQNRINGRAAQITTLGTTKTNSPAGTQASTIKSLEALNHPEGADMKRLTELRQQAAADRQGAQEQFQYDQDRARQQAEAKRKSEQSLFDMVPGTRQAIAVGAPVLAAVGGYGLGRKLGPWGGMGAGALGGALESAAAIGIPTEADYRGLPETSPAQQKAAQDLSDWDWYTRAGGMAGINAAIGAMGGFKGGMSRRGVLPMSIAPGAGPNPPPAMGLGPMTPAAPTNGLATASQFQPLPAASTPSNALAAASVMRVTDKNGKTIYMNRNGGFAKKEDIERFLNPRGQ